MTLDTRTLDLLYRRLDEATNLVIAARADVMAPGSAEALDGLRDLLTDCFGELAGIVKREKEEDAESERLSCYTRQHRRAG